MFTKNRDRLLDADVAATCGVTHISRHTAHAASQRKRKLIEEAFGWAKTIAAVAKVKVRGLARVRHCFTLAMIA